MYTIIYPYILFVIIEKSVEMRQASRTLFYLIKMEVIYFVIFS